MRLCVFIYVLCLSIHGLIAQNKTDDILFTIDDDAVTETEFLRVYNKNLDLVKDDAQKEIDNYLDLFINYKLKLKEAFALKLDEKTAYKRELGNYRKQLVKNYITDNKVTDALVEEAYDRVTNEVKAVHILVRLEEHDKDTLKAYEQISNLRKRFLKEEFETLQKELHNAKTLFVEDLGYFSGFKMVYAFENAAYSTKPGEISEPFRTRFGYHVVKVLERRPSRGTATVAHIMVTKNAKDSTINAEYKIKNIYKKLNDGETFEALAKQFSDDKSSASKGGKLKPFKSGQLSAPTFEDVAFGLKVGEVSKPFETKYGWHIAKLIDKKATPDFKEMKPELEVKVKRDSRSKLINESLVEDLKKLYNISNEKPDLSYFVNVLDPSYYEHKWQAPTSVPSKKLIAIGKKELMYQDMVDFLSQTQRKYRGKETFDVLVNRLYNDLFNAQIRKYHEDHLEDVNPEFAQIVGEYRDGLLLFDLMEEKIWNAAKTDTLGLQKYYKANKANYVWPERADIIIASDADKKSIKAIQKQFKKGVAVDKIKEEIDAANGSVIITKDVVTKNHQLLPENFQFKNGVSEIYQHNNAYHVAWVNEVLPKGTKTLDEAKGFVITDYQEAIEKQWLQSLKDKYKVSINKAALKSVKSAVKQ